MDGPSVTAGLPPGPALTLGVNLEVFESQSPGHQKIVEQVARASNLWTMSLFMANNSAALQRLQSGGVKLMEFPDSVWDAFGAAAKEVMEEPMDDEIYAKCYESFNESLRSSAKWISRSEGSFSAQRNRVMGL